MQDCFPKEYYFKIQESSELEVVIVVGFEDYKSSYWVECNLLTKENRKIFRVRGKSLISSMKNSLLVRG